MAASKTSATFPARKRGTFGLLHRAALESYLSALPDGDYDVVIKPRRSQRSTAQNARYWALLTVGATSLWGDPSEAETLHEEIAHMLLSLPPCEKTGIRRRMRTPKLNTAEFTRYMDMVADKLIELGADLSEWDAYQQQMERAA